MLKPGETVTLTHVFLFLTGQFAFRCMDAVETVAKQPSAERMVALESAFGLPFTERELFEHDEVADDSHATLVCVREGARWDYCYGVFFFRDEKDVVLARLMGLV